MWRAIPSQIMEIACCGTQISFTTRFVAHPHHNKNSRRLPIPLKRGTSSSNSKRDWQANLYGDDVNIKVNSLFCRGLSESRLNSKLAIRRNQPPRQIQFSPNQRAIIVWLVGLRCLSRIESNGILFGLLLLSRSSLRHFVYCFWAEPRNRSFFRVYWFGWV